MITKYDYRNMVDMWNSMFNHNDLFKSMSIVDTHIDKERVSYSVDLPGVNKDNLSVVLERDTISIKAERKGRTSSSFDTQFTVSSFADLSTLDANLTDGVLMITFMRKDKGGSEPKRIEVKSSR